MLSGDKRALVAAGVVGAVLVVAVMRHQQRTAAPAVTATPKPSPASPVGVSVPGAPPAPVSIGTPAAPSLPQAPQVTQGAAPVVGPDFGKLRPPVVPLVTDEQARAMGSNLNNIFMPFNAPSTAGYFSERRELAHVLVSVARAENWPLDLLIGHCWAEGGLRLAMTPNRAGAVGPLQVTPIACKSVGMPYPPPTPEAAVLTGVRYLKQIRRNYPEARNSLSVAFRMYGIGPTGYRNWIAKGERMCEGICSTGTSVQQAECGCNRHSRNGYTQKILDMATKAHEHYHTRDWWAI